MGRKFEGDVEALAGELTRLIIEHLNLEDVEASEVDPDAPLFGEGLGLDSVDALEMVMLMETTYGATIESSESGRAAFETMNTLAAFVSKSRTK